MIIPLVGYSQFKANDAGDLEYELLVQADTLTAQELHDKTAEWAALTYNDSQKVTKLDRDDKIIINARTSFNVSYNGFPIDTDLLYSLVIAFKDGRYKIDFTNLIAETHQAGGSISTPVKAKGKLSFESFKEMMYEQVENLPKTFQKTVLKQYAKDGYLEQAYEDSKSMMAQTETNIKLEIERISENLQDYIKSSKPESSADDW